MVAEIFGYFCAVIVGTCVGTSWWRRIYSFDPRYWSIYFNIPPVLAGAYSLFIDRCYEPLSVPFPKIQASTRSSQDRHHVRYAFDRLQLSLRGLLLFRTFPMCFSARAVMRAQRRERMLLLGLFAILMVAASVPMIRGKARHRFEQQKVSHCTCGP